MCSKQYYLAYRTFSQLYFQGNIVKLNLNPFDFQLESKAICIVLLPVSANAFFISNIKQDE